MRIFNKKRNWINLILYKLRWENYKTNNDVLSYFWSKKEFRIKNWNVNKRNEWRRK